MIDTMDIDTIMCLHIRIIFIIDIIHPQMVIVCEPYWKLCMVCWSQEEVEQHHYWYYVWFVDPRKRYNNITIDIS